MSYNKHQASLSERAKKQEANGEPYLFKKEIDDFLPRD